MKTEIFYFSGTGNSLYIARQLAGKMGNVVLTPIISALNAEKIETDAEAIGFVFPIHAFTTPKPVKEFIQRLEIKNTSYIFAVATRGGSPCKVFTHIDKILKKKGKLLDAQFFVNMPNNYLPAFDMPTNEEIETLMIENQDRIEFIRGVVRNRQQSKEKDSHGSFIEENVLFPILTQVFHKTGYFNTQNNFYSDSNCTRCGVCAKVCLSEKIKMDNGKPIWDKCVDCIYCFACIHYCPTKAIQIRKTKTNSRGRYHHSTVSVKDIALQKGRIE